MTEQSPLERAARALAVSHGYDPDSEDQLAFGKPTDKNWNMYENDVRAVLMAIRNIDIQTDNDVEVEMLIKGCAVLPEHDEPMQEDALNCWQAMIDAALEKG